MVNTYYLISKNNGKRFSKYKGNAIRLTTQIPYTVDEVVIGVKGKFGKERKITTFRDSNGKIIERAFDYFNKPYKNLIYSKQDYTIGNENFVTSTTIKEYTLKRNFLSTFNDLQEYLSKPDLISLMWKPKKIETNHLCENINNGTKILSRVSVTNLEKPTKQKHSYIEFPQIVNGKRKNNKQKHLEFIFNSIKNSINSEGIIQHRVKLPKKDSFLPFRTFDMETFKENITMFYIKLRDLKNKNISINTNFLPETEKDERILSAIFSAHDGSINFNKFYNFQSKSKLIGTIRHEVEHAWQFYLDARNSSKENRTQWQHFIFDNFGPIKSKKLRQEVDKYSKSIKNYVRYDEDFEKYKQNYIEILANKVGEKTQQQYDTQGKNIRKAFPFIPPELL